MSDYDAALQRVRDVTASTSELALQFVESVHLTPNVALVIAADAFDPPPGVDRETWLAARVVKLTT